MLPFPAPGVLLPSFLLRDAASKRRPLRVTDRSRSVAAGLTACSAIELIDPNSWSELTRLWTERTFLRPKPPLSCAKELGAVPGPKPRLGGRRAGSFPTAGHDDGQCAADAPQQYEDQVTW
jgi:hypothetical protein